MTRQVTIVPHTHWDREWYLPFQTFRLRLVELLDDLLPRLDADPGYAHFLLDGQLAVVDDYLAVRPDAEAVIARLVREGRLAVGPWYTLPDEFLVSAETHVRNLQRGIARAAELGGTMEVGYLPDMFGHVAQMPQILRLAGFAHAVVWRGVPSAIDRTGFWWRAPDGSCVRAEFLPTGYGNGAQLPDDARALLRRIAGWEHDQAALLGDADLLLMNGSDHLTPQGHLGHVVAEANALAEGRYRLRVTSLAEHLADAPTDGLPTWQGELRSGAGANLLMGVASNRTDIRVRVARAERALEQLAEPMSALFREAHDWPGALLDEAWLLMIRNAAHDSVCACSIDEVCDAVAHRYDEARQIADGLAAQALATLGRSVAHDGPIVVNPTARARRGIVELLVPGHDAPADGVQLLAQRKARRLVLTLPVASAVSVLNEVLGYNPGSTRFDVSIDRATVDLTAHFDGPVLEDRAEVIDRLRAVLADTPGVTTVRYWHERGPSQRVLLRTTAVDGYGWAPLEVAPLDVPAVTVEENRIANGLVVVEIDPRDGTFSIDGQAGHGRLVSDGDVGDTYNYSPPAVDRVVDTPVDVVVEMLERGPLRAVVRIVRTYPLPIEVDAASGERVGIVPTIVTTMLTVHAGERHVGVEHSLDNRADDHRLRVWHPLPHRSAVVRAECAFGPVERGTTAEGGPQELGLATFPSRRFVQAGGLTIVHEGMPEHQLVDLDDTNETAGALAITVLRSVRYLSRDGLAYRQLPAGPQIELHGCRMHGPLTVRYALATGDDIDAYALAAHALSPLLVAHGRHGGTRAPSGSALSIVGGEVSSVQRRNGALEVRVFNPSDAPCVVTLAGRRGNVVDLRDRVVGTWDGEVTLSPWQIMTLTVHDAS